MTELSYVFIILPFKCTHYDKIHLLIQITLSLTHVFEMPMLFRKCFSENVMLKFLGKAYFGKHLVPFLFTQFMDFKTLLVQFSVSCNDPPFSFSNIRLFDFTTPFPIVITIRRLKAVPVPYSNYNCFKFCHQVIWKQI